MQTLEVPISTEVGKKWTLDLDMPGELHAVITTAGGTVFRIPVRRYANIEITPGTDLASIGVVLVHDDVQWGPRPVE